jgi:hypothetical protein
LILIDFARVSLSQKPFPTTEPPRSPESGFWPKPFQSHKKIEKKIDPKPLKNITTI